MGLALELYEHVLDYVLCQCCVVEDLERCGVHRVVMFGEGGVKCLRFIEVCLYCHGNVIHDVEGF